MVEVEEEEVEEGATLDLDKRLFSNFDTCDFYATREEDDEFRIHTKYPGRTAGMEERKSADFSTHSSVRPTVRPSVLPADGPFVRPSISFFSRKND